MVMFISVFVVCIIPTLTNSNVANFKAPITYYFPGMKKNGKKVLKPEYNCFKIAAVVKCVLSKFFLIFLFNAQSTAKVISGGRTGWRQFLAVAVQKLYAAPPPPPHTHTHTQIACFPDRDHTNSSIPTVKNNKTT